VATIFPGLNFNFHDFPGDFFRTFQVLEILKKKNPGLSRRHGNPAQELNYSTINAGNYCSFDLLQPHVLEMNIKPFFKWQHIVK